jgi:hypothetical protein
VRKSGDKTASSDCRLTSSTLVLSACRLAASPPEPELCANSVQGGAQTYRTASNGILTDEQAIGGAVWHGISESRPFALSAPDTDHLSRDMLTKVRGIQVCVSSSVVIHATIPANNRTEIGNGNHYSSSFSDPQTYPDSPYGERRIGALTAIKARAPVLGGNFGVWGGLFSTFDVMMPIHPFCISGD